MLIIDCKWQLPFTAPNTYQGVTRLASIVGIKEKESGVGKLSWHRNFDVTKGKIKLTQPYFFAKNAKYKHEFSLT